MRPHALLALPALLRPAVAYTALSNASLHALPAASDVDFNIHDGALLAPILVPRVPGSPGSTAVLTHLTDFFTTHLPDWHLTFQNSTAVTPTSDGQPVPFRNLIATRDPPWLHDRPGQVARLALVAHYDSKLTPPDFIGATDSAAPCAMLLYAARALDAALTAKWSALRADGLDPADDLDLDPAAHPGVQILLLDGEEAFDVWTHDDSLYGARALAEHWEASLNPALSAYRTPLHSIDLFVLLDLLGSPDPSVPSYFKTTHWAYRQMAEVEARLRAAGVLRTKPTKPFLREAEKKDTDRWLGGLVEDDHLPFMARGVEILHLIPNPFPSVWHKMEDDGEHLDVATVEDWAVITAAFAAEWLELEGFLGDGGGEEGGKGDGEEGAGKVVGRDEFDVED